MLFSLFSEPTATILESNTDGVSDKKAQEEDDDLEDNGDCDTVDKSDWVNKSVIWLMSPCQ